MKMRQLSTFDVQQSLRSIPWRRLFKQPKQLERWIYFQLSAVMGSRTKEQALLAFYAANRICYLTRNNGYLWVAKYFLTCFVLTKRAMGGRCKTRPFTNAYQPDSNMVLVSLARSGLPRFILKRHRVKLSRGIEVEKWVRVYLTIFSLFKLVIVDTVVDINDIIRPSDIHRVWVKSGPLNQPAVWLSKIRDNILRVPIITGLSDRLMWTAGPNTPPNLVSSAMVRQDAQSLLCCLTPMELHLLDALYIPGVRYLAGWYKGKLPPQDTSGRLKIWLTSICQDRAQSGKIGKLGSVAQPAGKTRLFAILDSISQRLLAPVHDWAFTILRSIVQDGTFNQTRPLRILIAAKHKSAFSYDLKSATDRMPAEVSEDILQKLWGDEISLAWRSLNYRSFAVPSFM